MIVPTLMYMIRPTFDLNSITILFIEGAWRTKSSRLRQYLVGAVKAIVAGCAAYEGAKLRSELMVVLGGSTSETPATVHVGITVSCLI